MYVDETGGATDPTTSTQSPDDMTVTVEGQEYTADVNFDLNDDGINDTAVIEHQDGHTQAFIDQNHDGRADHMVELDDQGNILTEARFDTATGQWVESHDLQQGGTGTDQQTGQTSASGTITADLPGGDVAVGAATVDTNHDGRNDTAVTQDQAGNTVAYTDANGDGRADVAVVIDQTGQSTTLEHTGEGQWTEKPAAAAAPSHDTAWGGGGQHIEGVAKIDATTGQWISSN